VRAYNIKQWQKDWKRDRAGF